MLTSDECFTPPIIIKSHDLHANDISRVVGEIASYTRGISSLPFFLVLVSCLSFGLSLASLVMVPAIDLLFGYLFFFLCVLWCKHIDVI